MNEVFFSPLIEHAIELAGQWHAGTYRKGVWRDAPFSSPQGNPPRVPVMSHVTTVALSVQRAGWGDNSVAAAFLHDVLEDPNRHGQRLSYDDLEKIIGQAVARLVLQVSEQKLDNEGHVRSWKERKIGYIEGLKTHSTEAAAISLADKTHNLWSINESIARGIDVFQDAKHRSALSAGISEQHWFYMRVLEATRLHKDPRLIPMRHRFKLELDRYAASMQLS